MKNPGILVHGIAVALIAAGVLLGGTTNHFTNLFLVWMFPVMVFEGSRSRVNPLWFLAIASVMIGLAGYGAVWTLGTEYALEKPAVLVYIGLAASILATTAPSPLAATSTDSPQEDGGRDAAGPGLRR